MTMTVTEPRIFGDPYTIAITGIPPATPVVSVWRVSPSGPELVQGTPLVLTGAGAGTVVDALYPLSVSFTYELHNGDGTVRLDTVGPFTPPQPTGPAAGRPQLIDVVQSQRRAAVEVIDVTTRIRRGRVSVFETIGVSAFTTVGDARLMSAGTFTVLFRSHAARDVILTALSSGGPVVMRVPVDCQVKLDEMWFTPQDVSEQRFGTAGAGVLSIDFVEVSGSSTRPLPPSVHVLTYAEQVANAAAAAQTYSLQRLAFTGYTYTDMGLSRTGIAP